jgi:hypothetical protein
MSCVFLLRAHFLRGLHYVCFILATIASYMDTFGNYIVEHIYMLITLTYD